MNKILQNSRALYQTILLFFVYFIYAHVFQMLFSFFGFKDGIAVSFLADIFFLIGMIWCYKVTLKQNWNDFISQFKTHFGKQILFILKWVLCLFLINFIGGFLSLLIFPELEGLDDNTTLIYELFQLSSIYTIFKALIFSIIAEELLFKTAVRRVVENRILFLIVSSFIYAIMNIAYTNFSLVSIGDLIQCFVFSFVLSWIYIKYDNIMLVMLIKFVYNLIPITIMICQVIE